MISMEVYKFDVFTKEPLNGNPVAVVLPLNEKINDSVMQKIAFELNVSETVFVESLERKFKLRFFTPTCEVPLCGHATVGAFHALKLKGLKNGYYKVVTKAGEVDVIVEDKVWFRVANPKILGSLNKDEILDVLGFSANVFLVDVGIVIGLVEIDNFESLIGLKPKIDKIVEFCRSKGITGICLYTLDSCYSSDASVRFFAPAAGISEDPVTGTANLALAYYLKESGILVKEVYKFEQGHVLDRVGFVNVKISNGFWVGGDAVCILEGKLKV